MSEIKKHRKQLRIGMQVSTTDGQSGRVTRIITDPKSRQPLFLAAKFGRPWRRREIVIPVSSVFNVDTETIHLNISEMVLAGYPDYEVTSVKGQFIKTGLATSARSFPIYYPPDNSGYMVLQTKSVPEWSVAIEAGMLIKDHEGILVGKVEGLILDQKKREGKYVVFRRDYHTPRQLIPDDLVEDVSTDTVRLRIGSETVERLPVYSERSTLNERVSGD